MYQERRDIEREIAQSSVNLLQAETMLAKQVA